MTKTIPETLEECKAKLKRIYKKKRISNKKLLIMLLIVVAFGIGLIVGVQSGYHQCLVDFKIVAGVLI